MIVYFVTPTRISYIDLISIGGSEKLGDETKIGQFASGLKYSMALMLRNQVKFTVEVKHGSTFTVETHLMEDGDKTKELILIREGVKEHKTGFSIELGVNWEPWMILREIYSNMKDEEGFYTETIPESYEGTLMSLEFDERSSFHEVWVNKHLYINEEKPLYRVDSGLDAYLNEEKYLRIYKQGVLVYEDRDKYSEYAWGIKFGDIDERRILSNVSRIMMEIGNKIAQCTNEEFLRSIIRSEPWVNENDFLSAVCVYGYISDEAKGVIYDTYTKFGEVYTYPYLYEKAKEAPESVLAGRKVRSLADHIWNYSSDVVIHDTKESLDNKVDETDLKQRIENLYKVTLDCTIKTSDIEGSEVIADKFNKCLLVGEAFNPEDDQHIAKFLIQWIDLTMQGNLLTNISLLLTQSLKK